jgi:hypothetical protein
MRDYVALTAGLGQNWMVDNETQHKTCKSKALYCSQYLVIIYWYLIDKVATDHMQTACPKILAFCYVPLYHQTIHWFIQYKWKDPLETAKFSANVKTKTLRCKGWHYFALWRQQVWTLANSDKTFYL